MKSKSISISEIKKDKNLSLSAKTYLEKEKKEYKIKVRFTFEGDFFVKAESKQQAKEYVDKHCSFVLGRGIHSSLRDDDIDWDFPVHPQKKVF